MTVRASEPSYAWMVGTGGRARLHARHHTVAVRFVDTDGRLRPVEVTISGSPVVDTNTLRAVPLGRIEAQANRPHIRSLILGRMQARGRFAAVPAVPATDHVIAGGVLVDRWRNRGDDFYVEVADVYARACGSVISPARDIASANGVPVSTVHRWVKEARRRGLLAKASARGRTAARGDDFYRGVARTYSELVSRGEHPAPALAEEHGVSVQTVHGWVREARRRGFLPPAVVGKAG